MSKVTRSSSNDVRFMLDAIKEAQKCKPTEGAYSVGAVIVKNGKVLSAGYSREIEGNTHAEECALLKLSNLELAKGAEIFITMEPCSTRLSGKEPCTQRILKAGFSRVVIGMEEPPNFVNCEGAKILGQAGLSVVYLKSLEALCKEPNAHLIN